MNLCNKNILALIYLIFSFTLAENQICPTLKLTIQGSGEKIIDGDYLLEPSSPCKSFYSSKKINIYSLNNVWYIGWKKCSQFDEVIATCDPDSSLSQDYWPYLENRCIWNSLSWYTLVNCSGTSIDQPKQDLPTSISKDSPAFVTKIVPFVCLGLLLFIIISIVTCIVVYRQRNRNLSDEEPLHRHPPLDPISIDAHPNYADSNRFSNFNMIGAPRYEDIYAKDSVPILPPNYEDIRGMRTAPNMARPIQTSPPSRFVNGETTNREHDIPPIYDNPGFADVLK